MAIRLFLWIRKSEGRESAALSEGGSEKKKTEKEIDKMNLGGKDRKRCEIRQE